MKIYQLYMDTWKHSYKGYFTSLEKAFEVLPECSKFKKALTWRYPSRTGGIDHDWDYNRNIRPVFEVKSDWEIRITLPGFRKILRSYEDVPEVKEPGKPYQPASSKLISEETVECDQDVGIIEYTLIPVDETQRED